MPAHDQESQFKFLIACIKHCSSPGKASAITALVDFGAVAQELGIVSKGAAAKRYERLMRAHGVSSAGSGRDGTTPSPAGSAPSTPVSSRSAKKRKLAASALADEKDDEEDVKPKKELLVKEEHKEAGDDGLSTTTTTTTTITAEPPPMMTAGEANDGDDVLVVCAKERPAELAVAPVDGGHGHGTIPASVPNAATATALMPLYDYHANYGFPLQITQMRQMTAASEPGAAGAAVARSWFGASQDPGSFCWHDMVQDGG